MLIAFATLNEKMGQAELLDLSAIFTVTEDLGPPGKAQSLQDQPPRLVHHLGVP
jgi:hypothetical protein